MDEQRNKPRNPGPKIITNIGWDLIYFLDICDKDTFGGLSLHMAKHWQGWHEWATSTDPQVTPMPQDWNERLNNFEKLLVLKAFRPEKLLFAFQNYVIVEIGKFFVESPSVTMEVVYNDTDVKTPLIFVLS